MRKIDLPYDEWKDVFENHKKFVALPANETPPEVGEVLELVSSTRGRDCACLRLVTHAADAEQYLLMSLRALSKFEKQASK